MSDKREAAVIDAAPKQLLIGNAWREAEGGATLPVEDPSTGETLCEVADATPADGVAALDAAVAAQADWAATAPRRRSEILHDAYALMMERQDDLALLMTLEMGKPLPEAKGEIAYAAEFFRWNAEEAVRIHGSLSVAPGGDKRIVVHHPPVGVVAMITPWNFPAAMMTRKLAPALAAGNGVVIKPAKETPLTALRIVELLDEVGLPGGIVNVVPTQSAGPWFDAAVDNRSTRMVSFTGSTEVGRLLLKRAADRVLKAVLELGGNAPFVVFDDADVSQAVAGAMAAKMRHSAETCTAANRFYVEAGIAPAFTEALAAAMADVKVGNGFEDGVTCGPLINAGAQKDVDGLVQGAVAAGAEAIIGGGPVDRAGWFYEPTVLTGVRHESEIARTEIFGPVAPIITFTDADEMIRQANDTELGLTGYVYTSDLRRGLAVSERIQAGMIGLNRGMVSDPASPFGGMKQSGLGREGASEGIYEFCETQYIAVDW
jgi:succinate-semialdehyde dehydrogenase/glutarate-semialdehyde dehydrogenase